MSNSWIEPQDIVRDVDRYVSSELSDAAKYENRSPLDESGIFSLHRLAAKIYAADYEAGERSAAARADGERTRTFDRKRGDA